MRSIAIVRLVSIRCQSVCNFPLLILNRLITAALNIISVMLVGRCGPIIIAGVNPKTPSMHFTRFGSFEPGRFMSTILSVEHAPTSSQPSISFPSFASLKDDASSSLEMPCSPWKLLVALRILPVPIPPPAPGHFVRVRPLAEQFLRPLPQPVQLGDEGVL